MVELSDGWHSGAAAPRIGGVRSATRKDGPHAIHRPGHRALAIGFEQIIQWRYGPMGIIAFVALSIGLKAKNATISGLGAVILVMLLAQSG